MGNATIITFSGKAQHGKDSSADILKRILEQKGRRVLRLNYADYLKYLATQYFEWDGNKDEAGRTLLQQLGTEKVRSKFPNFWVDNAVNLVKVFEDDFDYVLIADCRFPNEINRWLEHDYRVMPIHVRRLNFDNGLTDEQKNHLSETSLDDFVFEHYLVAENLEELEHEITTKLEGVLI